MSSKAKKQPKRKPQYFSAKDLNHYILEEAEKSGRSKEEILEETFHDGYVVISESGDGAFKVEGGQLFKPAGERVDDLTECRRLRERFGPIAACVDYIKDVIMGSGYDVMFDDINDEHQRKIRDEIKSWLETVYQDAYTVGFNHLLDILVDNALTDGFAAAEIVFEGEEGDMFQKYAKPITSSMIQQESGKLAKSDYTSYEIKDPDWATLRGIARLKIFMDAPTRLRLYRRNKTWEADYWVLDQPNVSNAQGGMTTAQQKNLQSGPTMQLTAEDLTRSTLPNSKQSPAKPSAYFLPWQMFSLSLTRRQWLEKGPSIILPAMKTAQLLEKIMNAVGEGIYRAGNKKYFIICGTKDRPWGAIHIRNLLSQIKDASEKNWSTIPVPAGFDLKEAGGTVFEAQNAINYFLRVIAGIMHVNPSVLGLDTREARNTTEVPYFTHLRMKEELRIQIQTQLIRLHIWASHGQKIGKQGGYYDQQWIPKLRAKTEDLLNPSDRLKLDIDILNAANPVMPQTKLEVERDIVMTRGWEVDLPTQEEYMLELKKQQEEAKKKQDELHDAQINNMKAPKPQVAGPKAQGKPEAPSEEKQKKRLDSGVNVDKGGSKPNAPRGSTRTPKEAKKAITESFFGKDVEETIPTVPTKIGDSFMIANPFASPITAGPNEFAGIMIEIIQLSGEQGIIARYNTDLSKIYIDSSVPAEMYKPIIAREILEYIAEFELDMSFADAEKLGHEIELKFVKKLGMNPDAYNKKSKELEAAIKVRKNVTDPPDIVHHETASTEESKIEESEPQKVSVDINVKSEPLKTEITIKEEEKKPQEPQKVELTIHNEPVVVKTEKQQVEVKLVEDEEKKAEEKELRKKKKELLEKMGEKLNKEDE